MLYFDPFGQYDIIIFHNFYFSIFWSLLVNTTHNTSQIQQWNAKKRCGIFSKLTIKTLEECQCLWRSLCQWGHSCGYNCTWICFNICLSIIYLVHSEVLDEVNTCTTLTNKQNIDMWILYYAIILCSIMLTV